MERVRKAMISQRNASANALVYQVGDLVKISTRVLQPREKAVFKKMQPLYIGPFEVTRLLGPITVSVLLPESYAVNNAFNFEDIRPWLSHECQSLEPEYPAVSLILQQILLFVLWIAAVSLAVCLQVWSFWTSHVSIES
jgi:hypothetical protein